MTMERWDRFNCGMGLDWIGWDLGWITRLTGRGVDVKSQGRTGRSEGGRGVVGSEWKGWCARYGGSAGRGDGECVYVVMCQGVFRRRIRVIFSPTDGFGGSVSFSTWISI